MVETWHIVMAALPILTAVLGYLGKLSHDNKLTVEKLSQRLLGHPEDKNDPGFIETTEREFEELDEKVAKHAETTQAQLRQINSKVNTLVAVVVDENETIDNQDIRRAGNPQETEGDFFRGGSRPDNGDD